MKAVFKVISVGWSWSAPAVAVFFVGMAQAQVEKLMSPDQVPEYRQCQQVLWSSPLTTLKDFVAKGYGARLSTGDLEDQVKGLRCSDTQIIDYMEHHGLPYRAILEKADTTESGHGKSNRFLYFCIRNRGLFTRLIFGDCGGVTSIAMVDDEISYIISHGYK